MISLPEALQPIAEYRQFILHRDKKPISAEDGKPTDPHDPSNWFGFEDAAALAEVMDCEVGFVFTANDPFFFVDIDKAYDGRNWSDLAQSLCGTFAGCAIEVSRSGTGVHIVGKAQPMAHRCKNIPLGIELYTEGRYMALGTGATGDASMDATEQLARTIAEYFPYSEADEVGEVGEALSEAPVAEWSGPEDDEELLARAMRSSSTAAAFQGRASFRQLFGGDAVALSMAYPSSSGDVFDRSSADAALCQHLAFWAGKHGERIDRLFRMSALLRDKWVDRERYRIDTVNKAIARCSNVYQQRSKREDAPASGAREGYQYMSTSQQVEHFAGCVYVRELHRAFVPDGGVLSPDKFRVQYGGYLFAMDSAGHKETKNAWEVFTESQGYDFPKVHGLCFRPEEPPGSIVEDCGWKYVNTYVPIETPSVPGDVSPLLNHIAAMIPDERDRLILLSYVAAIVQYPGVKFQWAPLIQGVQGNGKTLLSSCIQEAVGSRYCHLPNVADMASSGAKFNGWLQGRLFIGMEEIFISQKRDFIETLKPLITNRKIEIQGKGADQITGDNRANFLLCSNHKDAILKTQDDRRYCTFYTAQQTLDDMVAAGWTHNDGSDTGYFPGLYGWLKRKGYAHVTHFLRTFDIPEEFNPATRCQRAPVTTSTAEAVHLSLGRIEQEILEAVEEDRLGFSGGWISSIALDRLLEESRDDKAVPPNKRRALLESLGYIYHPGLKGGRCNSPSLIDDCKKPRLYVKRGHIKANILGPAVILDTYINDQQGETSESETAFAKGG